MAKEDDENDLVDNSAVQTKVSFEKNEDDLTIW